jgi:hypothetical protein
VALPKNYETDCIALSLPPTPRSRLHAFHQS